MRAHGASWRAGLLASVVLVAVCVAAALGPIAQDRAYHAFADQRRILGVPHFADVVSNAAFALAGALGLLVLLTGRAGGSLPELRPAYGAFFAGALLIAAGSAWYHLDPRNETLVWDRLPMTVSFVSFLVIVLGEHASVRLARRLLGPLLVLGAGSVAYWAWSARLGHEDLRPYLLVQVLAIVLTPLLLVLYPSRLTRVGLLWGLLASYAAALAAEALDRPLYAALGVSGHTLKHLFAGAGMLLLAVALRVRRPLRPQAPGA